MSIIKIFAKLPIDLGQGEYKHNTKAKLIAFAHIPTRFASKTPTALDVGCGDGYWSKKLNNLGYKTTSIDIEREYPNVDADQPYEHTTIVNVNAPMPFPDNSFNIVWCSEVIEHLDNYQQTIREMRRVLRPAGKLIITTPNSFFWLHYVLKIFGLSNKDWQNKGHVNFFHIRDIKRIFPAGKIYGYFPYTFIKFAISRGVSLLSPNFVIIENKV